MHSLPKLKPHDKVEIIAPASRCSDSQLAELKALLSSWQLDYIVSGDIFGTDLFCANTEAIRYKNLQNALHHPETKAIICARGGYGSMQLIPALSKVKPPATAKLFVGMSDITALNLFLQQNWQWPTIHGALAPDKFSPESINQLKSLLFGDVEHIEFSGQVLNPTSQDKKNNDEINNNDVNNGTIECMLTGGNLSLLQTSIGTSWQMNSTDKIIFIEEIGERAYRIDRMLEHLTQAGIFNQAKAIILGDFLGGEEANGQSLIPATLNRFANKLSIPVVQIAGVGHGRTNYPLPLGTSSRLVIDKEHAVLSCTI